MNKNGILTYYKDFVDSEGVFHKTLDQLMQTQLYYEAQTTDFLTPDLAHIFVEIAKNEAQVKVESFGVFDFAERVKLFFYPEFSQPDTPQNTISLIQFDYNDKFNKLLHKDVLGALMALGVQRKKIGDIVLDGASIQVAVDESLESYFLNHIDQIGRAGVKVKAVDFESRFKKEIDFSMIQGTVKSLRLDGVLSMAMGISRTEAQKLINSDSVKVNYKLVTNVSLELKQGDLVSVRKYGRFVLKALLGQTKKDRTRLELAFYSR